MYFVHRRKKYVKQMPYMGYYISLQCMIVNKNKIKEKI